MTVNLDFKVTGVIIDALDILCAQLMRDLFATAKFSFPCKAVWQLSDWNTPNGGSHHTEGIKKITRCNLQVEKSSQRSRVQIV